MKIMIDKLTQFFVGAAAFCFIVPIILMFLAAFIIYEIFVKPVLLYIDNKKQKKQDEVIYVSYSIDDE